MSWDENYKHLLRLALKGDRTSNRTGVDTFSTFGVKFEHDLQTGFPLLGLRKLGIANQAVELAWMMRGLSDNGWLKARGCSIWDKWANLLSEKELAMPGELGRVYGAQWRSFGDKYKGKDQLFEAVRLLVREPSSRRIIISAWSPNESAGMALPPCHVLFQFSARPGGLLDLMVTQRSMDLPVGGPHDVSQFALFLTLVAMVVGMVPKRLVVAVGDLHVYQDQADACERMLARLETPTPELLLDREGFLGPFNLAGKELAVDAAVACLEGFEAGMASVTGYKPHDHIKVPVAA